MGTQRRQLPVLDSRVNVDSLNFNNVGVHANGKVVGLTYAAEADWQFGKAKGLDRRSRSEGKRLGGIGKSRLPA